MADFDPDAYIKGEGTSPAPFDPDAYAAAHSLAAPADDQSLLARAGRGTLGAIGYLGNKIDAYTGAPVRAAIGAAQNAPDLAAIPAESARAYGKQFGEDPSLAPSGKQLAATAGLSTDSILSPEAQKAAANVLKNTIGGYLVSKAMPGAIENAVGASPAGVGGAGLDIATNPVNYLPVEKLVASAARGAGELAAGPASWGAGKLGSRAEQLAVKAGGGTGKQIADFAPGTGRVMLDTKAVRFGSDPAAIAQNTQDIMDAAEASKKAMVNGPLKGAVVDRNAIYNNLQSAIADLSKDESQLGVVKHLQSRLEDIAEVGAKNGTTMPIAESEGIRRGWDKKAKWSANSDADALEANRITANAYRQAAEDAATSVDPKLGAQFKADKTLQATLIPVQKSAQMRANTLAQSPHGGLLDLVAITGGGGIGERIGESVGGSAGGMLGGAIGGGVGYAAKALRPRYASMGAVTTDTLAKAVAQAPQAFAQFGAPLAAAAQRGPAALSAMHNALMNADPAYPAQLERVLGHGSQATGPSPASAPQALAPTGPARWQAIGIQNLGITDPAMVQRLISDPKALDLIHSASNYPPGSKALKSIQNQLRTNWGTP